METTYGDPCYYDLLGVSPNATKEKIAQAYKDLAIRNHSNNSLDSEIAFKKSTAAYRILTDDGERQWYDQILNYSNDTLAANKWVAYHKHVYLKNLTQSPVIFGLYANDNDLQNKNPQGSGILQENSSVYIKFSSVEQNRNGGVKLYIDETHGSFRFVKHLKNETFEKLLESKNKKGMLHGNQHVTIFPNLIQYKTCKRGETIGNAQSLEKDKSLKFNQVLETDDGDFMLFGPDPQSGNFTHNSILLVGASLEESTKSSLRALGSNRNATMTLDGAQHVIHPLTIHYPSSQGKSQRVLQDGEILKCSRLENSSNDQYRLLNPTIQKSTSREEESLGSHVFLNKAQLKDKQQQDINAFVGKGLAVKFQSDWAIEQRRGGSFKNRSASIATSITKAAGFFRS